MRLISKIATLFMILLPLTGCSEQMVATDEIKTALVTAISSDKNPQYFKVIALANGAAEIIAAMGLKSILIGRDIASTDQELKDVAIVTSGHQVIAEKILALDPDLVIIDDQTGPAQAIDLVRGAGIKVVMTKTAWRVNEIGAKVKSIADSLGVSGAVFNPDLRKVAKVPAGTRILFLYLRGASAIYLIGGQGSGTDSLIESIGAVDAGAQTLKNPFNSMTAEALISAKPDLILVMTKGLASVGGKQGLLKLPGLEQSKASVLAVDDSLLLSFGPRTPDLIKKLADSVNKMLKK